MKEILKVGESDADEPEPQPAQASVVLETSVMAADQEERDVSRKGRQVCLCPSAVCSLLPCRQPLAPFTGEFSVYMIKEHICVQAARDIQTEARAGQWSDESQVKLRADETGE